jgi:hypothetical protein
MTMIRTALIAAALLASVPVVAGEWDGSLNYTLGGGTGAWSASIKDGRGTAYVAGSKVKVVRDGNRVTFVGDGVTGSGKAKNGKVSGTFTRDGAQGTFSGKAKRS